MDRTTCLKSIEIIQDYCRGGGRCSIRVVEISAFTGEIRHDLMEDLEDEPAPILEDTGIDTQLGPVASEPTTGVS